jgi:hypothetical protein
MRLSTRRKALLSERRTAGNQSAALNVLLLASRCSRATAMFSRTVSAGKSRAFWNDRVSPSRDRASGASRVASLPAIVTTPASAST